MLSSPTDAAYLFYGLIIIALIVRVRPWRRLGAVVAGVIVFGYVTHAIVGAIAPVATAGSPGSPGWIGSLMNGYVIVPKNPTNVGNALLHRADRRLAGDRPPARHPPADRRDRHDLRRGVLLGVAADREPGDHDADYARGDP